jgi:type I restriction enzyme R subunit
VIESEARTRKERIDARLRSPVLNWIIVRHEEVRDFASLVRHAVEEYPTATGPADYALFVDGKLLGIIEAKKESIGAENALEQAKRYSRSVPDTIGEWRGYRVPFLYSTNGESIFHLDVRKRENTSRTLADFHSPQALLEKYFRDTEKAERWFLEHSVG